MIREAWDAAGVHPRDVRTLDDFAASGAVHRQGRAASLRVTSAAIPYGGLLCVAAERADGDDVDVGHDRRSRRSSPEQWGGGSAGRPAIMYRDFWGMGVRPGDHVALVLFTFRGPDLRLRAERSARCRCSSTSTRPRWNGSASCRSSTAPDRAVQLRRHRSFTPYATSANDAASTRATCSRRTRASSSPANRSVAGPAPLAEQWGVELYEHSAVGDVTASFECRAARRPALLGGHGARRGDLSVDGTRRRWPTASAASSSRPRSTNRVAPLDPLPLRRHRARCAREHMRVRPHARPHVADRPQGRRGGRRRPLCAAGRRVGRDRVGRCVPRSVCSR